MFKLRRLVKFQQSTKSDMGVCPSLADRQSSTLAGSGAKHVIERQRDDVGAGVCVKLRAAKAHSPALATHFHAARAVGHLRPARQGDAGVAALSA